jgi:protein SCO1/2
MRNRHSMNVIQSPPTASAGKTAPLRLLTLILFASALLGITPATARAQTTSTLKNIGIDQHLGGQLPLDVEMRDEHGKTVRIADYFHGKPVIVTPVYYRCPMLCGLELNGLLCCLRAMTLTAGIDFEIVTYSIDPKEDSGLASKKQRHYVEEYGREAAKNGWHFLTGSQESITKLNEAIGFRAEYNAEKGQYAHAAGIAVCTPTGKISKYFFGVDFVPRDLRLGLVEASENTIGTLTDQVMLFCYMYDPTHGKYGLAIMNLIRVGGVLTVLAMAVSIGRMLARERRLRLPLVASREDIRPV